MPAMTSILPRFHDRDRQVGRRAAEHVGEDDDAGTGIGARHRIDDVATALLHIVVGADRHGFKVLLRSDNMLDGVPEFLGQLTVRYEHESDHSFWAPVMALHTGLTLSTAVQ